VARPRIIEENKTPVAVSIDYDEYRNEASVKKLRAPDLVSMAGLSW
jgi:hypothetical protein